jgi:phosphoglycerate dehydrogenase-like enzyme
MNISVYITDPVVDCWNFKERHRRAILEALSDARVTACSTKEELVSSLREAQIALIWNFRQEWFDAGPGLEWIVTPAAGRDFFKVVPPERVTIDYCSFHGELIGETVLGMMLAHARGIKDAIELRKTASWPRAQIQGRMRPLRGSHLVILGFGNIGKWIGALAKPFGVRITGIKRASATPPAFFDANDRIVLADELDSVLPDADHLALALPGGDGTRDIIDARRIGLLPGRAFIYNVGRGNAIDEDALVSALGAGRIAGAFLDVVKEEPLPPDSALLGCPNCTIMPHASAISPNYLDLFVAEFIEKYKNRYTGKKR